MTFSQLSLEYFFQKKADGKILSGSTFVFRHSQGFPLIRVVSAQTQTTTEIATHPSLISPHFSLLHYQKHYLKPAWLFSAFWMYKGKSKITPLTELDSQIQDMPGSNPNPSFSLWSPSTDGLTLLLLCQPSHPTRQNQVFSESYTALLSSEVAQQAKSL